MMKKTLTLFTIIFTIITHAQCDIKGNNQLLIGEPKTYQIDTEVAQCQDCHKWTIDKDIAEINGDQKRNKITIHPKKAGTLQLNLSVLTPLGLQNCNKTITITENKAQDNSGSKPLSNCDINFSDFKEIKLDNQTAILYPNQRTHNYTYNWTIYNTNGDNYTINDIVPSITLENNKNISHIIVKITSPTCIRTFKKTYNPEYWSYFKEQ